MISLWLEILVFDHMIEMTDDPLALAHDAWQIKVGFKQCEFRWPVAEVPGSKDDGIDPLDEILEPNQDVPDFAEVGGCQWDFE